MTTNDTHIPYDRPHDFPSTTMAADGETTLHRFRVDAVIYAPTREHAVRRLEGANIYLDAARVTDSERSAERRAFLGDVITSAVEGGTGYWAQVSQYQYEYNGMIIVCTGNHVGDEPRAVLHEENVDGEGYQDEALVVTLDVIEDGIAKIMAGGLVSRRLRGDITVASMDDDAGAIDSSAADAIVQVGLFGKLVYG